jgi:hypothetical protein
MSLISRSHRSWLQIRSRTSNRRRLKVLQGSPVGRFFGEGRERIFLALSQHRVLSYGRGYVLPMSFGLMFPSGLSHRRLLQPSRFRSVDWSRCGRIVIVSPTKINLKGRSVKIGHDLKPARRVEPSDRSITRFTESQIRKTAPVTRYQSSKKANQI